jgi:hypothetical protein
MAGQAFPEEQACAMFILEAGCRWWAMKPLIHDLLKMHKLKCWNES